MDIQRVNKYNEELKKAKDDCSKLTSEIEYCKRELTRLCEELTNELGFEVSIENVEQVYKDEVDKIERNLDIGEEILSRIYGANNNVVNNTVDKTVYNIKNEDNVVDSFGFSSVGQGEQVEQGEEVGQGEQVEQVEEHGSFGNLFGNLSI